MSEKITIKNNIIIPGVGNDSKSNELKEVLDVCSDEEIKKVVEEKDAKIVEEEKKRNRKEIPQKIKDFRRKWEDEIDLDNEKKKKIIKAINKIAPKIEIELDGSRRIEMKIGGKEYKILDINTKTHTDDKYGNSYSYNWMKKDEVKLSGMKGDNVDNWKNQTLKEYVKMKQKRGFQIPKIEEMRSLLNELGKEAEITKETDQIAMLMYLTGMYGWYWLSMGDRNKSNSQAASRSKLDCSAGYQHFRYFGHKYASLCMIAYG